MRNREGEMPPREGIIMLVVTREGDGWAIASFQNTDKAAPRSNLTTVPRSQVLCSLRGLSVRQCRVSQLP